ncbi:uncharacterized protein [Diadema setosum]|uniref:uncharacterized protein n=1 Tax=Diadema setosum TaxID=31175 RepID=UPI003B3A83D0
MAGLRSELSTMLHIDGMFSPTGGQRKERTMLETTVHQAVPDPGPHTPRDPIIPATPQPFAVISEHWSDRLNLPSFSDDDVFSFGPVYEDAMYKLIHKHLELDTHDRFAYVGASKGSFAEKVKEKFCLLQPMVNIYPGLIHYEETSNQRMLPFKISHVGAEEYFRQLSKDLQKDEKEAPFDKIMLKDSCEHFTNPAETFLHIMKTISPLGKMLIIHRPGPMNTLPFFSEANKRLSEEDSEEPYTKLIRNLQRIRVDVKWEIETLPIVMPKVKWLAMLKKNFPPQMEIISKGQVQQGIRELTEGMLKYSGETVEFYDRLLFITACHPMTDCGYPSVQRCGASATKPYPGLLDQKFTLTVTPDIYKYMQELEKQPEEKKKIIR